MATCVCGRRILPEAENDLVVDSESKCAQRPSGIIGALIDVQPNACEVISGAHVQMGSRARVERDRSAVERGSHFGRHSG